MAEFKDLITVVDQRIAEEKLYEKGVDWLRDAGPVGMKKYYDFLRGTSAQDIRMAPTATLQTMRTLSLIGIQVLLRAGDMALDIVDQKAGS